MKIVRVQDIFGQGEAIAEGLIREEELRELLRALDDVPSYTSGDFNPRKLIRAVNLLQPLGKKRALAAIQEYLRVAYYWDDEKGQEGTFLVLRVLFELPEARRYMPMMWVGGFSPSWPENRRLVPRFPIVLKGDIPFLVARRSFICGYPEQPEWHMKFFQKHGVIRKTPLRPTTNPFGAYKQLVNSPQWLHTEENDKRVALAQFLRLIDTVHRVKPTANGELLPYGDKFAETRKQIVNEASAVKLRWDSKRQCYTTLDGTTLPPITKKLHRRFLWEPKVTNLDVEVVTERLSADRISIDIQEMLRGGVQLPKGVIRVYDVKRKDQTLTTFQVGEPLPDNFGPNSWRGKFTGQLIEQPEGTRIQFELKVGNKVYLSPVTAP